MAAGILSSGYYRELASQANTEAQYDPEYNRDEIDESHDPERAEAAFKREAEMEAAAQAPEYTLGRAIIRDANQQSAIALMSRYQATVERTFHRSLNQLHRTRLLKLRNEPTESQNPAHVPHNFTSPEPLAC